MTTDHIMNYSLKLSFIVYLICAMGYSQTNQDARMLGLNGAYTTLASGYRAVGINPANLAVYKSKSFNIIDFSIGLNNNFFSIQNHNALSGSHLDDSTSVDYFPKEQVLTEFRGKGIRIMQSFNFPFPGVNLSTRRFAISSRLSSNIDMGIPDGMLRLFLEGNPIGKDLIMDIKEFFILSQEMGVSYGHSFSDFSAGFTLKYLLGIFYMGMFPISSASVITSQLGLLGNPQYIIQQAIGGGGIGLDVGITSNEFVNGYRFGISVINLLGTIKWSQDHFIRASLENTMANAAGDYYLRPNEFMLINFVIDSVTAKKFSAKDPLIFYEMYKVIPLDEIPIDIKSKDSSLVVTLEDGTYLYPSGGKYKKKIFLGGGEEEEITHKDQYKDYIVSGSSPFRTRHPVYLRLGFSKRWEDQAVVAFDLVTGFSNRFGSSSSWRLSMGTEITRFKNKFLRLGYAFGGLTRKSVSFGYGMKLGNLRFDIGISLNGGFSPITAKGIDLATGVNWRSN